MKSLIGLCFSLLIPFTACGAGVDKNPGVLVYGGGDGEIPGWAIFTDLPMGWTPDCCAHAKAIGVNLALYKGEWTGRPERVMLLNIWTARAPTLSADFQKDRQRYRTSYPAAKDVAFPVANTHKLACLGSLYQRDDHKDDVVVFCEPDKASRIRLSWSMLIAADDPERQQVLAAFKQVVEQSMYMKYQDGTGKQKLQGNK
ncbi:hypothetical protein IHE49_13295 [Rhodanobacter sp. 7MK24]|uniref:hypothetical protein n=1 Tax=Rhodanobacter sp. 7MK24 TaxID=2775922 RepID=UPI00177EF4C8|nr:hypothetical protein [Rhodanobacter sp. 7MK24]MBD8881456.1 hypothetical protein [Rhodanobacter sp. 7MK24]